MCDRVKSLLLMLVAACLLWPFSSVLAEEKSTLELRAALQQRIDEIKADGTQLDKAMQVGQMRTALCKTCHGKEGYSVKPQTPNLAGQNPVYIVDQFSAFADGRRKNYMMSNLAKNFSQEDMIMIAIYYSHKPAFSGAEADPLLVEQGRQLYSNYCTDCHGKDASGPKGYARLAGQRADYIVKALKDFKQPGGERSNPIMYGRAQLLRTEEHMKAVAAYLSQL